MGGNGGKGKLVGGRGGVFVALVGLIGKRSEYEEREWDRVVRWVVVLGRGERILVGSLGGRKLWGKEMRRLLRMY